MQPKAAAPVAMSGKTKDGAYYNLMPDRPLLNPGIDMTPIEMPAWVTDDALPADDVAADDGWNERFNTHQKGVYAQLATLGIADGGAVVAANELKPEQRASVNLVRTRGSMNPYTGEPDILTLSSVLMDEAAAQARNNGPQMIATTDQDIALQRRRQAFADSLTGRGESFEMRAGRSLMDAAGLVLGPETFAIGLGTKIVQGALALSRAGSAASYGLGRVSGTYSAIEPGPLADSMAGTFAGGRYTAVKLEKDTILYRAGTADEPLGQFFSLEPPTGVLQTRIDKAVLPVWPGGAKSPIDTAFAIKIPAGTQVYLGKVGSQGGVYIGGTPQVVVQKPWLIEGVKVMNSRPLK